MDGPNGKRDLEESSPTNLNLGVMFELINHQEQSYAFFAVSRLPFISELIGLA